MRHLFYLLVGILAIYELIKMSNYKKVFARCDELRSISKSGDNQKQNNYIKEHPAILVMCIVDLLGWIVLFAGLMTNQWLLFLSVMFLSLSRFQRLGSWAVCIDSIVTAVIYLFAIINTYHLHIELS